METLTCPHCQTHVALSVDGTCPSCRKHVEIPPDAAADLTAESSANPYRSPTAPNEPPPARPRAEPVKIRAYGLFRITRKGYLILQAVMIAAFFAMLFALQAVGAAPGHPLRPIANFINRYFALLVIGMLVLEALETTVMLAKFKKAEREQARE